MSTIDSFKTFFDKSSKSLVYWEERAILDFTEGVLARLERTGITKTSLAERLGVSLPYVTKLIGGSNNFTLKTMVKVARALGARISFEFKEEVAHKWLEYRSPALPSVEVPVLTRTHSFTGASPVISVCADVNTGSKPKPTEYEDLAAAA